MKYYATLLFNLLRFTALLGATWWWLGSYRFSPSPVTYFVSTDGADWYSGTTIKFPLRTIQVAADRVLPGDRIVILPGTYNERLHLQRGGISSAPVIVEAAEPGSVTLTWAASDKVAASWHDEGNGIFSAEVDHPVYRMRDGLEDLYRIPWGGRMQLEKLCSKSGAMGAFCVESDRIYVRLKDQVSPAKRSLSTHLPVPVPREWGEFKSANIWVEADHLVIRGLNLEFGIGAAVLVWNGEDIRVEDCAFSGATIGVKCGAGIKPARQVTVERCLYHNYPQHEWLTGWLNWNEVYAAYSSSTLVTAVDDGTVVRNCVAAHVGDALRLSSREANPLMGVLAEGNWLLYGTDDAAEIEGPVRNVTFRRNLVYQFHESLGLSPAERGPVLVEDNLFIHPDVDLNGAQVKLILEDNHRSIRNIEIRRNAFLGNWLSWRGVPPVENVLIHDNVFAVRHQMSPRWPSGVIAKANRYINLENKSGVVSLRRVAEIFASTDQAPYATTLLQRVHTETTQRPGPTWWNWESHPATQDFVAWSRLARTRLPVANTTVESQQP